jgi:hypothetical protein
MSRPSPIRLAVPLAIVVAVAGCTTNPDSASPDGSPAASVVVGDIGGEVTSSGPLTGPGPGESPGTESTPEPTPAPTPAPTPRPTSVPQEDGFTAVVRACESISGDQCNNEYGTMPAGASSFTALVTFTDANAGDTINVVLSGPSGTFPGGAYTLQGGGNGYYYSNFSVPNLAAGTYTLTASRNGADVATSSFTKSGG